MKDLARDYLETFESSNEDANEDALVRRIAYNLRTRISNAGTYSHIACADNKITYSSTTRGSNKPVAWDLIPKSDAYNVASFNLDRKRSAISAAFSFLTCLLYTSPSPRDATLSRMPSSA